MPPKRPFTEQATELVTGFYDRIMGCREEKLTGELVCRVFFSQGGIGQVKFGREENMTFPEKEK